MDGPPPDAYRLRAPCRCGSEYGVIDQRNGQACVFCLECGKFLYNAPKHERGLAPEPVRSDGITPGKRYEVELRAGFVCEFCGRRPPEVTLHVGHLLSEHDIREARLPLEWADHFDNLSLLCDACNLGMGKRSLPIHPLLVFILRRHLNGGKSR